MSWRHRCYGFNVLGIIYLEQLDKLKRNQLILNDFLTNIITMTYQVMFIQSKQKRIPFKIYRKKSRLSAIARRLFQFLKLNITDLQQIHQEVDKLTHLFLHEVP